MQKMGYVIGTGLGRNSDGRLDPVTAVILPAGKSLGIFCMSRKISLLISCFFLYRSLYAVTENAGGDKDLFSVERKLKRLQKRQEAQNQKVYEQEKKKVNIFNFLNDTLSVSKDPGNSIIQSTKEHRKHIKSETLRNLNISSLKTEEDIRRVERELYKIKESLTRHSDARTQMHISLKSKLIMKQEELRDLQAKMQDIKNERSIREDQKKLTIF